MSNLPLEISASRNFLEWLNFHKISLAFTTHKTNRLFFIGIKPDGTLSAFERFFESAMGLNVVDENSFFLSTKYQIWQFHNTLESGQTYKHYDKLFVPRIGYTTGDLFVHDLGVDCQGDLIFLNTRFNCLATTSDRHSFKPLWKPSFTSKLPPEDCCRLSGLAMKNGKAIYVTAFSQSDIADGWRDNYKNGGIIIDVESNQIITNSLSMPHSPRWYQDKLWVVNSGRGEFGYIDLDTGKFEVLTFCPGYPRGLTFWDDYAIIGISKPKNKTFAGLDLDELLTTKKINPRCGFLVVNLNNGDIVHWVWLEGITTQLYNIQVLPNARCPMSLGFQNNQIAEMISVETNKNLIDINTKKNFESSQQSNQLTDANYVKMTELEINSSSFDQKQASLLNKNYLHYCILAHGRTGSNLLCRQLINAGLGIPTEYFNRLHQQIICQRIGVKWTNINSYLDFLLNYRTTENQVFGFKLQPLQYQNIQQIEERVLPKQTKYLYLYRSNLLKQAISFHFALITGKWGFNDDITTKPSDNNILLHDLETIKEALKNLIFQYQLSVDFVLKKPISPLLIRYEDYAVNQQKWLSKIIKHFNVADYKLVESESNENANQRIHDRDLVYNEFIERYGHTNLFGVKNILDWHPKFYFLNVTNKEKNRQLIQLTKQTDLTKDLSFQKSTTISMSTLGKNGRFANQIFQYGFLKTYAKKHNLTVQTRPWIGKYLFGCQDSLVCQQFTVVKEFTNDVTKSKIIQNEKPLIDVDFWGFFQYHTSYYAQDKDYWRSLFQPVATIKDKLEIAVNKLKEKGNILVGLHLRRGDYVEDVSYYIPPNQYYQDWLKSIWGDLDKPVLFIASDEIEKVIDDFEEYQPITSRDLEIELPEADFYPDFYILTQCDLVAISNSSFSFAACMLNEKGKTFVRPCLKQEKLVAFNPWDSEVLEKSNFETNPLYNQEFYQLQQQGSINSAREIIPLILEKVKVKSVVDVGCGVGTWLSVFDELQIKDVLGIDGDYVDKKMLYISPSKFQTFDLKQPLSILNLKKFDLVVSLEVAEHLPPEFADTFVDSLTSLGYIILFSAAIPMQGGKGHLNEQFPEYWIKKFSARGFLWIDFLRDKIWHNEKVEFWYAQNVFIFVKQDSLNNYPLLAREISNNNPHQISRIHPKQKLLNLKLGKEIPKIDTKNEHGYSRSNIQLYLDEEQTIQKQREYRLQLSNNLLTISASSIEQAYQERLGELCKKLIFDSQLKYLPLTHTEANFVNQQLKVINNDANNFQSLLVIMIYCHAHQLPSNWYQRMNIPSWLVEDYWRYLLIFPQLFQLQKEVDKYRQHVEELINYLHGQIVNNLHSKQWQKIARIVSNNINLIALYFSDANLRNIYLKKSEILEFCMKNDDFILDYQFSKRANNRVKIRLGIFVLGIQLHPESYCTLPIFEHINRENFEVILYSPITNNNPLEKYAQTKVDKFVVIPNQLNDIVNLIRKDDLDILFIGANVTVNNSIQTQLISHRLGRIQVTSISSPVTTGIRNIDYYISGKLTENWQSPQQQYREKLLLLNGCGFCFSFNGINSQKSEHQLSRKKLGIKQDSVVYISGANLFKIIPEVREAWARILTSVDNSVLVLLPFSPWSHDYAYEAFCEQIYGLFNEYKIKKSRLVLLKKVRNRDSLKEYYKLADIYLNSFPYAGSISIIDALEVNLPVVTQKGDTLRSSMAAAILQSIWLKSLITGSEEEYVNLAIALGKNVNLRKKYSQEIKQRMQYNPPFLDTRNYGKQIGDLFQQLWQEYQEKENNKYLHQEVNKNLISCADIIAQSSVYSQQSIKQQKEYRFKLAQYLLQIQSTSDLQIIYQQKLKKACQELIFNSQLKYFPITEKEKKFVNQQIENFQQNSNSFNSLLVIIIYYSAHQLPFNCYQNISIPNWFAKDYFQYLLAFPQLFQTQGENNKYYHYMENLLNYLHHQIFANSESKQWQKVAQIITNNINLVGLYFNDCNLKNIYTKSADIIECTLKNNGFQIDYKFPDRVKNRNKIRLGIFNIGFKPHTEAFTTLPAFEYLNRDEFEIILYVTYSDNDSLEQYCRTKVDDLIVLSNDLKDAVNRIRQDDLDIFLVGTNVSVGASFKTCLATHRLGRIQLTCFSSPVSTGIRNMDYYVSGKLTTPLDEAKKHYREKLLTIDDTGFCFNYDAIKIDSANIQPTREKLNIPVDSIVFISGANFFKLIPETREVWAKILASVDNSVLVLYPFSQWTDSYAFQPFLTQFYQLLSQYNIEKERLIILPKMANRNEVKKYLKLADIYLDAIPYSGANSNIDPLEVNLPIIVMEGNTLRANQGAAILKSLGLNSLITNSKKEYIELAIKLGNNSKLRQKYYQEIEEKMNNNPPFLDSNSYSEKMSSLLKKLWEEYQQNSKRLNSKKKVISFSLWGDNPRYTIGAIKNADLAPIIYPEWICRFYVDKTVPENIIQKLSSYNHVEIVKFEQVADSKALFWRFYSAADENVEVSIFRDTDSRLNWREKAAVDEWLKSDHAQRATLSDRSFHIIRDHPYHNIPIMGGAWGVQNIDLEMVLMIENYLKTTQHEIKYGIDQHFLIEVIYPLTKDNSIVHDEFFEKKPFPIPRENYYDYVGRVFLEDGGVIHEYDNLIKNYLSQPKSKFRSQE